MTRRGLFRALSMLLAAAVAVTYFAACGKDDRSKAASVTFRIMSWNEDFRGLMEAYFIPRHPKLMKNVRVEWITEEINTYREGVRRRLANGEQIDLFLGDNETAPFFAADNNVAALSDIGVSEDELSHQYGFTRTLGSDLNGVQKGSAFTAEPGVLIYRTDYAEKYLGVTHQEEMQEKLSSWESFLEAAKTLNENSGGKVKMLPNSAELWKSVECAMSGLWVTDGQLSVSDETAAHWLDTVKELEAAKAFAGVKTMDDKWYSTIENGVMCFYAAPWLCKSSRAGSAEIDTIFSFARRRGTSFGKFRTSLAPNGFVYGGNWLYCPKNSANKEIAAEIIRAFTCDAAFMKRIALAEMQYVNNDEVCRELAEMNIQNPLFEGLDAFSVYNAAAGSLELSVPTVYDSSVSRSLYNQTKAYSKGEIRLSRAIYNFRLSVWKKHEQITSEP